MKKFAIAIHGGAGQNSPFLKKTKEENKKGLVQALQFGYEILRKGGSALDAVEESVKILEDNPLFNAGRGSALNCKGEVEMDASIMNGKNLDAGAVSMVRNVKNPIVLARIIMNKTDHVFFSGYGALEIAQNEGICLEPESYFITEHQYEEFAKLNEHETTQEILKKEIFGTVGAVALDKKGNVAAGTSTGGTSNSLPARIGDSCVIGAGCYANNESCAISGTGKGEYLITGVIANTVALMMELKQMTIQAACDYVIHTRNKKNRGHLGIIAVNPQGEFGISYNTQIMKRAWMSSDGVMEVKI